MSVLTVVTPFYNEERTLRASIERVLAIADEDLTLDIVLVDDCSRDGSPSIAAALAAAHPEVRLFRHTVNQGKGAALSTGFAQARGDFVAIHDADLEYDPRDLKRLVQPLIRGEADVVFGSRFLSGQPHRVLHFWHQMGNSLLTLLSNMFTDLNLTDMETCYKVFRRELIQSIQIEEKGFGVEPEMVAKVAAKRVRIYEMGISYFGRTYEEGKKIGVRDGFWALYCILRYNAPHAPLPIQFFFYLFIGGTAALFNLLCFEGMRHLGVGVSVSALTAFWLAAVLNYVLCILILFRHQARWSTQRELLVYLLVVVFAGGVDLGVTNFLVHLRLNETLAKITATAAALVFNFLGRRFLVFPEEPSGPWKPQNDFDTHA